jgi:hypothetical protein
MFDTGVVTTPGLNMRERPGGKIINIVTMGDRVVILGRTQPGKKLWYYVRPEAGRSHRGYVLASDVALDPPQKPAEQNITGPRIAPTESVREEPKRNEQEIWWVAGAALVIFALALLLWGR